MEKLREYISTGEVSLAKMNGSDQPEKAEISELEARVSQQNKYDSIMQQIKDLDWDERYEWMNFKRLRANEIYRSGNINKAIDQYVESLLALDLKDKVDGRLEIMNELKFSIMLNIATCLYRKKEYSKAIAMCDKILQENHQHLPAIYKKVYLLIELGEFFEGKQLLKNGFERARSFKDSKMVHNFVELNKELIQKSKTDKSVYVKIFNPEQEAEFSAESDRLLTQSQSDHGDPTESQQEILYPDTSILSKILGCLTGCINCDWISLLIDKIISSRIKRKTKSI